MNKERVMLTSPLPPAPIAATGEIDTSPITTSPPAGSDLDRVWTAVVEETRTRSNDIHLPISLAYAERLLRVHPQANSELVRITTLLHDTGWARVDSSKIISEGFAENWREADIRYQHEVEGCNVAREVLPGMGYEEEFVEEVCRIIDGHDTRAHAKSLEDALVRDADRLWRFDHAGIALASGWFGLDPATYSDRLEAEILPELLTEAGIAIARADLERSRNLLKTRILR